VAICFLGHTNLGRFMSDRYHMQAQKDSGDAEMKQ
jgi:hypothetical protein